jgi:hypothetical protein
MSNDENKKNKKDPKIELKLGSSSKLVDWVIKLRLLCKRQT